MIKNHYRMRDSKMFKIQRRYIEWEDVKHTVYLTTLFILLNLLTCAPAIESHPTWNDEHFPLVDSGKKLHTYKKEPKIGYYEEYVYYCVTHYNWEHIKAVYDKDMNKLYRVRRHKMSFK